MCFLGRFFCLYRLMTRFGSRSTCWTPADFCLCRTAREANFEHTSWHNFFRVQSWCPARVEIIINWPSHFHPSFSHLEAETFPVCWRRCTLSTVGMDGGSGDLWCSSRHIFKLPQSTQFVDKNEYLLLSKLPCHESGCSILRKNWAFPQCICFTFNLHLRNTVGFLEVQQWKSLFPLLRPPFSMQSVVGFVWTLSSQGSRHVVGLSGLRTDGFACRWSKSICACYHSGSI